jgi:hypothetical protein
MDDLQKAIVPNVDTIEFPTLSFLFFEWFMEWYLFPKIEA